MWLQEKCSKVLPFQERSLWSFYRKRQPRPRQVFRRIKIQQDSRVFHITIDDAGRIRVYYHPSAPILRRVKELCKDRPVEQHRMAPMAIVTRDDDRLSASPICIDDRGECLGPHGRVIGQMNQRRGASAGSARIPAFIDDS